MATSSVREAELSVIESLKCRRCGQEVMGRAALRPGQEPRLQDHWCATDDIEDFLKAS